MNDLDDIARFIENGSKIYVSEKSNVITKKWIPEDFVFPKDHNKLCFKPLWCKTYKWLAYSKSCNGVYCVTCVLFGMEIIQLNVAKLSAFYKGPFYDWKHAIQRFKRHASSAIHKNADVDLMHFKNIKIYHKYVTINQQLNNAFELARKQIGKYYEYLFRRGSRGGIWGFIPASFFGSENYLKMFKLMGKNISVEFPQEIRTETRNF